MAQRKYLNETGLSYFWGKIKGFFVKGNTGYYFAGTSSTAAATVDKEVTCSDFTVSDLSPGVTVNVIFANTNSGTVGSLTLNVSGTGAKPIKYIANNAYGSLPSAGYLVANLIYTFVYDGTNWVVCNMNYNSNDPNYRNLNYYGLYKTYTSLYRYEILLTKSEGMLLPINTVDRGQSSSTKVLTTESFDPFGEIFWYQSTSIISAGGNIATGVLYRQYLSDMRYSFNVGISSANYLTARNSIFLVASPQSDGSAKLHSSPISNSLPSSDDGLIYIYLGQAYDTYRIDLSINHPIYWYKNGAIRPYVGGVVTKVTAGAGLSGGDITSTGTIAHSNSVTAQTTQALYPVKIDAQGHISAYGDAVTNATAASGGTTVSLVTTGDKYTWNHKPSSNVELGQGYGTCANSSTTTACTVTLANYLLVVGGIVVVKFSNGVIANSTLNVNSKGAKPIKYQGANIPGSLIMGGDIVTFIYDGTNYHVLAIDRVANSAAVPADYVTATASNLNSGLNGYTMWASGKLEIWLRQTVTGVNINNAYGNMYYGSIPAISYQLTPTSPTFVQYPVVNITVQGPAGIGIAVPNYDNYSTTDTGTIYLYNPASVTNKSVTVNIYAVGRWKLE